MKNLYHLNTIIEEWASHQQIYKYIPENINITQLKSAYNTIAIKLTNELKDKLFKFSDIGGGIALKVFYNGISFIPIHNFNLNLNIDLYHNDRLFIQCRHLTIKNGEPLRFVIYINSTDRWDENSYDMSSGGIPFIFKEWLEPLIDILYDDLSDDERAAIKLPYLLED